MIGFLGEVCDRRDFHVLSLDVRKGTLTCAAPMPKYFRKPESVRSTYDQGICVFENNLRP